ncbi:MAG: hypothetical protein EAY72_14040, partial [Bacteroidetes bacterium]
MQKPQSGIGFKQFRSFATEYFIDFEQINIITGQNNSGKSNISNALLFLKQNVQSILARQNEREEFVGNDLLFLKLLEYPFTTFDNDLYNRLGSVENLVNASANSNQFSISLPWPEGLLVRLVFQTLVSRVQDEAHLIRMEFVERKSQKLVASLARSIYVPKTNDPNNIHDIVGRDANDNNIDLFVNQHRLFAFLKLQSRKQYSNADGYLDDELSEILSRNLQNNFLLNHFKNFNYLYNLSVLPLYFLIQFLRQKNSDFDDLFLTVTGKRYHEENHLMLIHRQLLLTEGERRIAYRLRIFYDQNTPDSFNVSQGFFNYFVPNTMSFPADESLFDDEQSHAANPDFSNEQKEPKASSRKKEKKAFVFEIPELTNVDLQEKNGLQLVADILKTNLYELLQNHFEYEDQIFPEWYLNNFDTSSSYDRFTNKNIVYPLTSLFERFEAVNFLGNDSVESNRVFKENFNPNSSVFTLNRKNITRFKSLNNFGNTWLQKFGIDGTLEADVEKLGNTVSIQIVTPTGERRQINDFGYGYRKLLPLIILCATHFYNIDEGYPPKTIIVEEPEANLHPNFQSLLAEMFVDAVKTFGIQFIIETHSEYLIRKLQ